VATLTFTGGDAHVEQDWNNPANWRPQQVPMDGDSVIISAPAQDAAVFNGGTINLQDLSVGEPGLIPGYGSLISVAGSFQWTGGFIADGGTIGILGQGSITGGPPDSSGTPALSNDCILDVTGALTITGPGSLTIGGGQCRILNSGTITLDQGGLYWDAGAPPLVTNNGTITVAGSVPLHGGDITNVGVVNIPAGSELVLMGGAVLRLAGGQITGDGILHPADDGQGFYGTVSIEADTVLPVGLTLTVSGIGYVSGADAPTPRTLRIDGTLGLNGGVLYHAHIAIGPKARCTVSGTASDVSSSQVDNLGVITLLPGAVWTVDGGAQINNSGRLSLQGDNSISLTAGFANMANAGLLESGGAQPNQISGLPVSNTGNIAIRMGILNMVSGASLTVPGGCVFVYDTTLDSSDATGSLILTGGATGGALRGSGIIGAAVTNGGSVEPSAAGLILRGGYTQQDNGSLVLPLTVWNTGSSPPIAVTGTAALAGSLFITG
jgi:hypothetical protein